MATPIPLQQRPKDISMSRLNARAGVVACVAAALLVGCSGQAPEGSRVDRVLEGVDTSQLSEFEQAVLEDGVVTQAEYDEAFSKWVDCMSASGITTYDDQDEFGRYLMVNEVPESSTEAEVEAAGDTSQACETGTTRYIDVVYVDQVMNPESQDWEQGVVDCLKAGGFVGSDYSVEDLTGADFPVEEAALGCVSNPFGVTAGG